MSDLVARHDPQWRLHASHQCTASQPAHCYVQVGTIYAKNKMLIRRNLQGYTRITSAKIVVITISSGLIL